jgi:alkaline phosphatase D
MQRRNFLFGAGALATLAAAPDLAIARETDSILIAQAKGLSILQGLTTETTTQLTVDVPTELKVAYVLIDTQTGKVIEPVSVKPVIFKESETRVDKIKFDSLSLGHRYQLLVKDKKRQRILDERFLSTVDLNKRNARVGLMSCMNNFVGGKDEIWRSARKANLDYLLFIGDNVYGDLWRFNGPSVLWSRYIDSREDIPYYHWKELKPVIAVWDDHDFGKNNSDGTYKHKAAALKMFETFFAQDPVPGVLTRGPGASSYFRAFSQNFAFFDDRYFRGYANPTGGPSFLGLDQIAAFTALHGNSSAPTWILQGAPTFGRPEKGSSYQQYSAEELEHFFSVVKNWNAPLIFGGGDLHFTEVSKVPKDYLGYETFEIISSSMHSFTKDHFYGNPNEHLGGYLKHNFVIAEQLSVGDPIWKLSCVTENNIVPFETTVEIA